MDKATRQSLRFDAELHEYWLGDRRLPSVTEILEPLYDYHRIPPAVLERKRQIGEAAHRATELDDAGMLDAATVAPEVQGYLEAWRRFRQETGFKGLMSETRVFSERYQYAGTLDRVGYLPDYPLEVLLDIKCTFDLHPATALQTAGYALALSESFDLLVGRRCAVQLKPDGTYFWEEYNRPENQGDKDVFLSLLNLKHWREKHGC